MRRTFTILAAGLTLAAVPAAAQGPVAPSSLDTMRLTLGYDGRVILKVLDVRINQTIANGAYRADIRMVSSGILSLFRRLDQRASVEGAVRNGSAQPRTFQHRNLNSRQVRAVWAGGDVTTTATPPYPNLGEPPANRQQRVEAVDPLTQAVRISLTADGRTPCGQTMRVFDGKQRYNLEISPGAARAPDRRERRIGLIETVTCTMRYVQVAGFRRPRPGDRPNQGLRGGIQVRFGRLARGGPWVLSSLTAPTPLGDADIELREARVAY